MAKAYRIKFTKTFHGGTLDGVSLPIHYTTTDQKVAIRDVAKLKAAATTGVKMQDLLTGSKYTVSYPTLVEVQA